MNLSFVESRTHFAAWVVTSSPLVLGFDITNTTTYDAMYPIVANKLAIGINQQWAGLSGVLVRNATTTFSAPTAHGANGKVAPHGRGNVTYPDWMVWRKPLSEPRGGEAVLVINLSDSPVDVAISFSELGMDGVSSVTDVWTGRPVRPGSSDGLDLMGLGPHDSVFYVLTPETLPIE